MKPRSSRFGFPSEPVYSAVAILCVAALIPGNSVMLAQQDQPPPAATSTEEAPKIPNDQLDSLVSPIALYPDPLLSQVLVASTYPLEIIQLQQWLAKNKNLKDKALADAVEKQNWDPSIQSMAALPDATKQLAENIQWTTDLGNAFLAQQSDVMDAVQRMRAKAQAAGNLKSGQQQKVETQTVEGKSVIVIQQANPQIVYVPAYNPVVVYGAPAYPYPPIAYPPGYGLLAFGAGVAIGAAWGNGGWGYGCGWGTSNTVNINVNNNYVSHYNRNNFNQPSTLPANGGKWQHNPQHRGAAPYPNRATANQFGGETVATARDARGAGSKPGGGGNTMPAGGASKVGASRPGGGASTMPAGGASNIGANRPGGGASTMPAGGASGQNRIGGHSPSAGGSGGAFGGGGMTGNSAKAASSRGSHSMGGGGLGGGGRSGGGGRRR